MADADKETQDYLQALTDELTARSAVDPSLAERMFAGQVVGQVGFLRDDHLRTGLFLLTPGLHYPMHTYAASEIYFWGQLRIGAESCAKGFSG